MANDQAIDVISLPLSLVVQIVNEWGDAPRLAAHGGTKPYPSAEALQQDHPILTSHVPVVNDQVLLQSANLLHPVFAANSSKECAQHLNRLLTEAQMSPAFVSEAGTVHAVWRTPQPERALLAGATLALINHLRKKPEVERLGTCDGDACADVYVDRSPAGRREFCSVTCQNRVRARTYRARKKTLGSK
jgi:predicted RNA-binding Zn ribbon-like protein